MTRVTTPLAVSADYADALLAARRAKNWMFLLLMLGLLAQITIFLLARFEIGIKMTPSGETSLQLPTRVEVSAPTTTESSPASPTTAESTEAVAVVQTSERSIKVDGEDVTGGVLAWLINSIVYLGTILSIVMSVIILLIVLIMLVGRLLGVSHSTSAYVWAVILAVLIFPWQLFYGEETGAASASASQTTRNVDINDYRVPGVLYTWGELKQGIDFENGFNKVAILRYARFTGFPLVALFILFMVQAKSGRGVKYALGETEMRVDLTTTDADLR